MKTLRYFFAIVAAVAAGAVASAQTQLFLRGSTGEVNRSFSFGEEEGRNTLTWKTGSTGVFSAGSTLTVNGTFNVSPTGGTWNLAGVTINGFTGGISDGDKGDVTVAGSGSTITIDDGAVTLGKMAPIATLTLLGRSTAGTGAVEVLLPAAARTLLELGGAATLNVGTGAGQVAAGDDARFTDTRTPTDGSVTTAKVQAATLVTAAEGVASNDNDTTIPTTAAVKAYADSVGGGTGNVTKGATFAAGQMLYITNATTGEISGIAGATYNSGNNTITFNGTVAANTLNITSLTGELSGEHGGTGVANTGKTITLGGNLTTSGANNIILSSTADSNVTLPTTGTLATVGGNIGAATATTPAEDDNSTKVATTAYVQTEIASLGGGGAYDTGDVKFILDSASVPSGWALTGANGIAAFTTPDADYKAVMKMAGTVATPTFSPVAGAVPAGHTITLSSATSGVTFMTTNNTTDPSRSVGTAGGTWVVSDAQTIETMAYKDGAYLIDSAVASAAYTIDALPEITAAEIDGTALTLTYSEAVSRGGSYSDAHFDLDMSTTGNNIAVTYVSGDGTATHTYTAATAAVNGETVDLDFSGTANSIEETGGYNQDLAAIASGAVTNSTAGSGPTLIANTASGGTSGTVTSSSINTTGANMLIVVAAWYPGTTANGTLSDSKGNTWTGLTASDQGLTKTRIFYCYGGTVGSGHTFTYAGTDVYPALAVQAWSGIAASPFDQENGATENSALTIATGSVTPSQANTILVSGVVWDALSNDAGTASINNSFTISNQVDETVGSHVGIGMAYKVLTASAATSSTWTLNGTSRGAGAIASFKY